MSVSFLGYTLAVRGGVSLHKRGVWFFGVTFTSRYGFSRLGRWTGNRAVFVRF